MVIKKTKKLRQSICLIGIWVISLGIFCQFLFLNKILEDFLVWKDNKQRLKLLINLSKAMVTNLLLAMSNLSSSKILMPPFVNCLVVFAIVSPRLHVLSIPHQNIADPTGRACAPRWKWLMNNIVWIMIQYYYMLKLLCFQWLVLKKQLNGSFRFKMYWILQI